MRKEFLKNDHFHNEGSDAPVEFEMSDYDNAKRNSPYLAEQEFTEDEEVPPGMEPIRPYLEPKIKEEPTIPAETTPDAQVEPTAIAVSYTHLRAHET